MASTSRAEDDIGGIRAATSSLYSDNQYLIADIRKGLLAIKGIAVGLEKGNHPELVKQLDEAVLELLATSDDCTHFSSALESVGNNYQPGDELTDFKKILEDEVEKLKRDSPSVPQKNPLYRQFKEAIWNVHHVGQPMPGEEQEDIVMTSTESNLLNIACPLSGKPVVELDDPVRRNVVDQTYAFDAHCNDPRHWTKMCPSDWIYSKCMDCKHIYDRAAVVQYMKSKNSNIRCPVAGCPKQLVAGRVVRDPLLQIEIEEMRASIHHEQATAVEDFTELNDDEN